MEVKGLKIGKAGEGEISLKRAALDFGAYIGVLPQYNRLDGRGTGRLRQAV